VLLLQRLAAFGGVWKSFQLNKSVKREEAAMEPLGKLPRPCHREYQAHVGDGRFVIARVLVPFSPGQHLDCPQIDAIMALFQ
jgi:hypothetical protein